MDRLSCSLAMCGLGIILVIPGCKLTRPEVPPGRPFSDDGRQRAPLSFSSDGHPVSGAAVTNIVPDSPGASKPGQSVGAGTGTNRPNGVSDILGGPGGSFGPPGTSGRSGDGIGRTEPAPAGDDAGTPPGGSLLPDRSIEPAPDTSKPPAALPDVTAAAPTAPQPRPAAPGPEPAPLPVADDEPRPEPPPAGSQVIATDPDPGGTMGRANDFPSPN